MHKTQKNQSHTKWSSQHDSVPPSPPPLVTVYSCFSCFEWQPALAGSPCSLPGNVGKERRERPDEHDSPFQLWPGGGTFDPGGAGGPPPVADGRDQGQKGQGLGAVLAKDPGRSPAGFTSTFVRSKSSLSGKCWILGGSRHLWSKKVLKALEQLEQTPHFTPVQRPRSPSRCQQCLIEHLY